jgi:hypothetical protein
VRTASIIPEANYSRVKHGNKCEEKIATTGRWRSKQTRETKRNISKGITTVNGRRKEYCHMITIVKTSQILYF